MPCKSCASAMFTQQGQEDGKSYLAYKDGGEMQTQAVMPDTFRSTAKCRVRETTTAKMSQNVLSWVLQQDSRDTHVNNHQSQQAKNFFKFSLCCVRKTFHTRWKYFLVDFWLQNLSSSPKSIVHFRAEIKTGCRGYFSPPYQLLVGYLETH